jgi:hypothetical protein
MFHNNKRTRLQTQLAKQCFTQPNDPISALIYLAAQINYKLTQDIYIEVNYDQNLQRVHPCLMVVASCEMTR